VKTKLYRRLPGSGRSVGFTASPGRQTLWIAPDHLLSLETRVESEKYRRFYFRDIEAFIVRRTARRQVWNWTFLILAVAGAAPFLAVWQRNPDQTAWLVTAVGVGAFWLGLVLGNTLRGPTCAVHIRTAVQIEHLPSLGRMWTFEKVLARLKPLIEEAQASINTEALSDGQPDGAATVRPMPEPTLGSGVAQPIRHEPGHMHAGLFYILLIIGALTLWDVAAASKVSTSLHLISSLAGTIFLIFALRRQSNSDLPDAVKRITWGVLGFYILGVFAGAALGGIFAVRHPGQQPPPDPSFLRSEPGYKEIMTTSGVIAVCLAVAGIVLLQMRPRPAADVPSV